MKTIMIELPKLIIFDFDNVMYQNEPNCDVRMLAVASAVVLAHYGVSSEVSRQNHVHCWKLYKDGFRYLLHDSIEYVDNKGCARAIVNPIKKEFRERQYLMTHHAFERILRNDVHGIRNDQAVDLFHELSEKTRVCFASHAVTPSLHMMMNRIGVKPTFLQHAFGMTCLGGGAGWARKDDPDSGVYKWLCDKYGVHPNDAMMVEDTASNLIGAKKTGLQTVHIDYGKKRCAPYIDHSYTGTSQFLSHIMLYGVANRSLPTQKLG